MPEIEYNPMALPEYFTALFQRWTHACTVIVPRCCGLCGEPSKGNWFTGYYLPCIDEHAADAYIEGWNKKHA